MGREGPSSRLASDGTDKRLDRSLSYEDRGTTEIRSWDYVDGNGSVLRKLRVTEQREHLEPRT